MSVLSEGKWYIRANGLYYHEYNSSYYYWRKYTRWFIAWNCSSNNACQDIWSTRILEGKTPYKLFKDKIPTLDHLKVLNSTVYILIYEEKWKRVNSKSAKLALRVQCGKLVEYDKKTIYRVYLEKNSIVIWVKDLQIYKDATVKKSTTLPIYNTISVDKQEGNKVLMMTATSEIPKRKRDRPQKTTAASMFNSNSELSSPPATSREEKVLSKQKRGRSWKNFTSNSSKLVAPDLKNNPQRPSSKRITACIAKLHETLTTQD